MAKSPVGRPDHQCGGRSVRDDQDSGTTAIGTVFEIANGTLTTLVSFNGAGSPADPQAGLIVDAAGDSFGTTVAAVLNNFGTQFELVNTGNPDEPYELEILWSFTSGADGAFPYSSLTTDAAGDLFGTTLEGGTSGDGAAFESASRPITAT